MPTIGTDIDGLYKVTINGNKYDAININGHDYVSVRNVAKAYGGGGLQYSLAHDGKRAKYATAITANGNSYNYSFTTDRNGKNPYLYVSNGTRSFAVNSDYIYFDVKGVNHVDVTYFRKIMYSITSERKANINNMMNFLA